MIFALIFVAAFGLACMALCWKMYRVAAQPLFCGECGKITDDLTDDDVCFRCNARLATPSTEGRKREDQADV